MIPQDGKVIFFNSYSPNPVSITLFLISPALLYFNSWLPFFIAIILSISLLTLKSGFELEVKEQRYRFFNTFLFSRFGKWKQIPLIDYISIVRCNEKIRHFQPWGFIQSTRFDDNENYKNIGTYRYAIHLVLKNSPQRFVKIFVGNINNATKNAKNIAHIYQLDILDATTPKMKWMKEK